MIALNLKPVIQAEAKKRQRARTDIFQKSDKSIDTKKELASIAGVSHDTIHKVEVTAGPGGPAKSAALSILTAPATDRAQISK